MSQTVSESLLTVEEKAITEEEEEFYISTMQFLTDPEKLEPFLQGLSQLYRTVDGLPIEPEKVFSGLLEMKTIQERTRFPNILDMNKDITCRLIADTYSVFGAFRKWANLSAKAFIGLRGEGRKEGVEILKAKGMIAQGISPIFIGRGPSEPEKKGLGSRLKSRFSRSESNE